MKEEPKESDAINDMLGHYVEGDYMTEEKEQESNTIYISPETPTGFRLQVIDHTIMIIGKHGSNRSFTFDTQAEWEGFCEAIWMTEHYIAVRKKDFIEFFQALRHFHGHHCREMDVVVLRQTIIQEEIKQQQGNLDKLKGILEHYKDYCKELYNESKV